MLLLCFRNLLVGCLLALRSHSGIVCSGFFLYLELGLRLFCSGGVSLCFGFRLCCLLLCGVSLSHLVARSYALVELCEIRYDFRSVVCLPEFEVGRALQQFAHTLRLTYAWHLHHDTSVLSFEFLDVRLYYAVFVDTVSYDIERVVDGRLHLCSQCGLNLGVSALCRNFSLELLCSEDFRESVSGCILLVCLDKERDEVALTCLFFFLRLCHRLSVCRIRLVVGKHVNYVRHRDFEYHVHTAFKVKSQTDLCLETLLVGIDTQILHRVFVVLLCDGVFNLARLLVVVACSHREGEVEDARKRQQDCCNDYNSFVLHFSYLFFVLFSL